MKIEGYAPDTREVAFNIDEKEKETIFRHSEKLTICLWTYHCKSTNSHKDNEESEKM